MSLNRARSYLTKLSWECQGLDLSNLSERSARDENSPRQDVYQELRQRLRVSDIAAVVDAVAPIRPHEAQAEEEKKIMEETMNEEIKHPLIDIHEPSDQLSAKAAGDQKQIAFDRIDDIGQNFLSPVVGKGEISFLRKHGILHSLTKNRAHY